MFLVCYRLSLFVLLCCSLLLGVVHCFICVIVVCGLLLSLGLNSWCLVLLLLFDFV